MRYLWVTLDLFTAFLEAKQIASDQTASLVAPLFETDSLMLEARDEFEFDLYLYPYGAKANRHLLETITRFSFEQGLIPRQIGFEEIFYAPSLEL